MAEPIKIHTPFTEEMSKKFHIGDAVLITGEIYAARDAAHKKMCEALAKGEKLPIDWHDKMVYYLGPTPAKPGDPIGSCGPTTSGRMDAYTPRLLDLGLACMIGKGKRSEAATEFGKAYQGLAAESGDYRRLVGMKLNALGIDPDAGAKAGAAS